ncbi:hypothetical protein AX15_003309 [Amanita polypyramis BW_CC]|nr:hypothetical protein AX15_003309 [Amanita polypyramis BW_CC]
MEDLKSTAARNTVRAPGQPFARPRTGLSRKVSINGESSALRASVLDVAMQIGLGANGAVTDWVYNNSVNEEEEEEPVSSLGLKYDSSAASFTVSEDCSSTSSARFPYSPPSSSRSVASSIRSQFSPQKLFAPGAFGIPEEPSSLADDEAETASNITSNVPPSTSETSPDASIMQLPSVRIPAKLKKRRGDGYESDAGYASEAKGKKDKKDGGSSASGKKGGGAGAKDEKANAKEEEKKNEAERHRAKSLTSQGTEKDAKTGESLASKGYETDAPPRRSRFGRKKKLGASEVGYETDAGYISSPSPGPKKSRSKFFRLGGKSSKPDLAETTSKNTATQKSGAIQLPALPPLPSLDASFATSISSISLAEASLSPLVSASSTTSVSPAPRAKSEDSKKDSASEKRVRDSHLSGESSRSSTSSGPARETKTTKHKSFRFLSSPKSSATSPSNKFPAISLPLGRAVSPSPSDVNVNSIHQNQGHPEPLSSDLLRSPSPSPSKSGSRVRESRGQYTFSSPLLSSSSQPGPISPAFLSPTSPSVAITPSSAPSSPPNSWPASLRPRYSQLTVVTTSNLTAPSPAPGSRGRSLNPNPSLEWVVPSSLTMNTISPSSVSSGTLSVPNSNKLSYYDIPPPSPPPNAPLPKVPNGPQSGPEDDPFGINGASVIRSLSHADRGKDVPFLSRLRARAGSHNSAKSNNGAKAAGKVTKQQISDPRPIIGGSAPRRPSDSSKDQEVDNDDVNGQDMRDVLDRFAETSSNHRNEREVDGVALGRSRSFEALHNEFPSRPEPSSEGGEGDLDETGSFYSRELPRRRLSTIYYSDPEEDGADPRLSRWSGSIYSRTSIMDSQKSEETRARFVKRVEAMLDEAGIERGNKRNWEEVPPVPKLPEELARSNILTRQNLMKNVGPADNS